MKKLFLLFLMAALVIVSIERVSATAGAWSSSGSVIYYNDGKLGLGTSNPQTLMHIKNPGMGALSLESTTGYVAEWFYPSGIGSVNKAYIGYGGSALNNFDIANYAGQIYVYPAGGTMFVKGTIKTKQVYVTASGWSDYVFEKDYKLKPLSEVESYINENKHLPNMPAESEIVKNGLSLGDMQNKQMEKIEELTLYIIQLKKEIDELKK